MATQDYDTRKAKQKSADYRSRREIVRHIKSNQNNRNWFPPNINRSDYVVNSTAQLAHVDQEIKTQQYTGALSDLSSLEDNIGFAHDMEYLEFEQIEKLARAIQKRAYRISKRVANSPELNHSALRLAKKLERRYGISSNSPLEKVAVITSIFGILGAIFFLSPNVTGNAIANMTNSTSNFLGVGLLIVGLVAGAFALKSK